MRFTFPGISPLHHPFPWQMFKYTEPFVCIQNSLKGNKRRSAPNWENYFCIYLAGFGSPPIFEAPWSPPEKSDLGRCACVGIVTWKDLWSKGFTQITLASFQIHLGFFKSPNDHGKTKQPMVSRGWRKGNCQGSPEF